MERKSGTVQAQLRAYYLAVQDLMKMRVIPGAVWRGGHGEDRRWDKLRTGQAGQYMGQSVGRVDRSNEHVLLTTKGCIRSRVVWRIPDGRRVTTLRSWGCQRC